MYSAVGFSYLAQKNLPLLRDSQVLNLLSSDFKRATDSVSMLVWATISGRLTAYIVSRYYPMGRLRGHTNHAGEMFGTIAIPRTLAVPVFELT